MPKMDDKTRRSHKRAIAESASSVHKRPRLEALYRPENVIEQVCVPFSVTLFLFFIVIIFIICISLCISKKELTLVNHLLIHPVMLLKSLSWIDFLQKLLHNLSWHL